MEAPRSSVASAVSGRGRPKLADGLVRTVGVRFRPSEAVFLSELAKMSGVSLSALVRSFALRQVGIPEASTVQQS